MKKIVSSFLFHSTLFSILIFVFFLFLSCKKTALENEEKDRMTEKSLIGVWQATFTVDEGGNSIKFPYKVENSYDVYMYVAYTPSGKVHVCAQKVDLNNGTIELGRTNEYDYSVKGNDITWSDEKGADTISFLLKDDRFTTIVKKDDGNIVLFNYKKTKSPTLEEITSADFIN